MTTTTAIDPIDLDEELDIETNDVIEEAPKPDGIDEDTEEEVEYFKDEEEDADDDDDEEEDAPAKKPKAKKEPKVKISKKSKEDDEPQIKRVPVIGQSYKTKYFAIEIIGKGKTAQFPEGCYFCKVTWATEPCRMKVGDTFEAGKIAFYSEYYKFVS